MKIFCIQRYELPFIIEWDVDIILRTPYLFPQRRCCLAMAINIVLSYCSDFLCMHVSFFSSPPGVFNCIYLSLSFYTALQSLPVLCGLRSWSRAWQLWSWPSGAQRGRDSCDWSMFPLLRPAVTTVTRNGTWIYRDHQQLRRPGLVLQTKVRKEFTITEKAPTLLGRSSGWKLLLSHLRHNAK